MVTSVNRVALMVSWDPPPAIDHNGLISGYVIEYTRDGSSDIMSVTVTSRTTHMQGGLVAYTDYSVKVAARNVNGTGPFSDPMVKRSGEDGEFNIHHISSNRAPCHLLFSQNLRQLRYLNK